MQASQAATMKATKVDAQLQSRHSRRLLDPEATLSLGSRMLFEACGLNASASLHEALRSDVVAPGATH